ncbi:MAG TPA: META domain-containing protein [Burkholderiales bacterium]|nr:META domain-containing protein [Burkholderiales bacterium]
MRRLAATLLAVAAACAPLAPPAATSLAGTSWRLVSFRGGDGTLLIPDERAKYTFAFNADGIFAARIDCNRARGAWTSSSRNSLQFGAMAITRAQCEPGSLHDQIVRQLPFVRSYVIRDGRLFLALMADAGVYELEPAPQ